MGAKKVKKEFNVWLKEDQLPHYKGSCLHVEKESKNFYYGINSSMFGSFNTKFLKSNCTKTNPMDFILKAVKNYMSKK